jgi:nickel/cobalt exporter
MDLTHISFVIALAFGLGMLHALDADHIMAVSGLIANQRSTKDTLRFCFRWAIGHGSVLLLAGILAFMLGWVLPASLSHYADAGVGIILIVIGTIVLINLYRRRIHVHFHSHDGMPEHAHWHSHHQHDMTQHSQNPHRHGHGPLLVGMLHGLSGSAPLLALIPMATLKSPMLGFVYLLIFSVGVLLSMLLFGGLLSLFLKIVERYAERLLIWVRALTGLGAIALGGIMLASFL